MSEIETLVVGAGLAGLVAARDLARAGRSVTVVDKAKGVGGRLATRRIGAATLDHGAQFFTVRTEAFRTEVDRWLAAEIATEWTQGFEEHDGHPRYAGTTGMNGIAKHLAAEARDAGVEIVTARRAQSVIDVGSHWTITYDGATRVPDDATSIILTPPTPQTLELLRSGGVALDADVSSTLEGLGYEPVLALLVTLDPDGPIPDGLGSTGARQWPDGDPFTFVADNAAKGISDAPAVTFHTAHGRSRELWDRSDAEVWDTLGATAAEIVAPARITGHQVKRWRYAGPTDAVTEECLVARTSPGPLVVAGDAFARAKVEGAWTSGSAAAVAVLRAGSEPTISE